MISEPEPAAGLPPASFDRRRPAGRLDTASTAAAPRTPSAAIPASSNVDASARRESSRGSAYRNGIGAHFVSRLLAVVRRPSRLFAPAAVDGRARDSSRSRGAGGATPACRETRDIRTPPAPAPSSRRRDTRLRPRNPAAASTASRARRRRARSSCTMSRRPRGLLASRASSMSRANSASSSSLGRAGATPSLR